jgi:hypothetical protein
MKKAPDVPGLQVEKEKRLEGSLSRPTITEKPESRNKKVETSHGSASVYP